MHAPAPRPRDLRRARRPRRPRAPSASTPSTPATPPRSASPSTALVLEPLPFPGNPDRPVDDLNLGKYLFEVRDLATNRLLYSRGYATVFGEWETTAEAKEAEPHLPRVVPLPGPGPAGAAGGEEARPAPGLPGDLDARAWTRRTCTWTPSPPAPAGPVIEIQRSGPPGAEARPAASSATDTPKVNARRFEAQARRLTDALLRGRALPVPARRPERLGALPAGAGERRLPPVHRHPPEQPGGRRLRRLRLGALRAGLRQPALPRGGLPGPVRLRGHPGQRRDLRRRRHPGALRHGGGRQHVGPLRLRPRAGPPRSPGWPTSTSPPTSAYLPGERVEPWERNVTILPDPSRPKWGR